MGLAEKRAIKTFQDNVFPARKKAIDEAAGFEVNVEVDWESLAVADYGHLYEEAFSKVYFDSLTEALKDICRDDMGRVALKGALKKVVLCNHGGYYGDSGISFLDGVLTVDHQPVTNIDDIQLRKDAITKVLEKAL